MRIIALGLLFAALGLLAGCYASHGRPDSRDAAMPADAGPPTQPLPPDAGTTPICRLMCLGECCPDGWQCARAGGCCHPPYHVPSPDGRCVWSCSEGTTPGPGDDAECICSPGLHEVSTDRFGRRVCR